MFNKTVGLEINNKVIRGVELSGKKSNHKLIAYGSIEVPEGLIQDGVVENTQALSNVIREMWKSCSFKSKEVLFGVDNKYVLVRDAVIPNDPTKKFDQVFKANVQKFLPVEQSSVEIDYIPLVDESNLQKSSSVRTIIVAARKKMIAGYVEVFEKSGLKLSDIEVNNLVMSRLIPKGYENEKDIMVINFKNDMMNILVCNNGMPVLARNVLIENVNDVNERYLETAGRDIVSSMTYYHSNSSEYIEKVFVTGFGVWDQRMINHLKEVTKTNVQVINPFVNEFIKNDNFHTGRTFEYSIAYALAVRGLESER